MNVFGYEQQESFDMMKYLYRHRVKLMIAFFVGIAIAVGASFLLTKKYRSTAIIYPPNSYTRDQLVSNPQFGSELEVEHLMQLLESASLRDSVIQKFNLIEQYKIDTNRLGWKDRLNLLFIKDVSFFRSKYLSVVIHANSPTPQRSADMANYIVDVVNLYKQSIFQQNINSEVEYYKERLAQNKEKLVQLTKRIYQLKDTSDYNNLITNFQIRVGKEELIDDDFIDRPEMEELVSEYNLLHETAINYKKDFQQALDAQRKPFLSNYVIDRATPNYIKVYPSRITNGLLGGFFLFFVVLVFLLFRDKFQALAKEQ